MPNYVQLGDVPTWYDEHGEDEPLARMNWEEPTLTDSDLSRVTSRTLMMLGDDDEVTCSITQSRCTGAFATPSLRWSRVRRTGYCVRSRGYATRSSSTSCRPTPCPRSRRSGA
jgi:hypothetical protein